jgi:large subunit ribosomal protein L15
MPGLHELKPAVGANRARRRRGRGDGSGRGNFSGRGMKGQKAHGSVSPTFEGGQNPLVKRLPELRGFTNIFRTEYQPVNLEALNRFDEGADVTPGTLASTRLVRKSSQPVKILGGGKLSKAIKVSAHSFSKSAREAIEKAGGSVTVLGASKGQS